ncbi:hypothetical protein HDV00_005058 [Rhizophlyctis rosea]|nr:hypothetical protein HDV00_005058 [Rhizophlyctis rosea]
MGRDRAGKLVLLYVQEEEKKPEPRIPVNRPTGPAPEAFKSRDKIPRNSMDVVNFVPPRATAPAYRPSPLARSMQRSDTPDSEASSPISPIPDERRLQKAASKKSLKVDTRTTPPPESEKELPGEVRKPLYYGRWTNYDDVPIPTVMQKVLDDEVKATTPVDSEPNGAQGRPADRPRARESPGRGNGPGQDQYERGRVSSEERRGRDDRRPTNGDRGRRGDQDNGQTPVAPARSGREADRENGQAPVAPARSRSRPRHERSRSRIRDGNSPPIMDSTPPPMPHTPSRQESYTPDYGYSSPPASYPIPDMSQRPLRRMGSDDTIVGVSSSKSQSSVDLTHITSPYDPNLFPTAKSWTSYSSESHQYPTPTPHHPSSNYERDRSRDRSRERSPYASPQPPPHFYHHRNDSRASSTHNSSVVGPSYPYNSPPMPTPPLRSHPSQSSMRGDSYRGGWGGKEMEMSYPGPGGYGHMRQKSGGSGVGGGGGSAVGRRSEDGQGGGRDGRSLKSKASVATMSGKKGWADDDMDDVSMRDIKAWTVRPPPPTNTYGPRGQSASGPAKQKKEKDEGCCIIL